MVPNLLTENEKQKPIQGTTKSLSFSKLKKTNLRTLKLNLSDNAHHVGAGHTDKK
jgi:hypothetical protein